MNRHHQRQFRKALGLLLPLAPLALIAALAWKAADIQHQAMDRMQDAAYAQRLVSEITESSLRARILTGNAAGYAIALEHAGFALEALIELPRNASTKTELDRLETAVASAGRAAGEAARLDALTHLEQATAALDVVMADGLESDGIRVAATLRTFRWLTALALVALLVIMLRDRLRLLSLASMRLRMQLPGGPAMLQLVSGAPSTGYRFTPKRRWP